MKLLIPLTLAALTHAQPAFEVASVKPAKDGPNGVRGGCHGIDSRYAPNEAASAPPLGRCVITDGRLSHMLRIAYNLRSMAMIKGGPDFLMSGDDRFNLEAKAEDPTKATEQQLLEMLQALLIERFNIKLHRETKEVQGFALIVGKNGPKFKDAKGTDVNASFSPFFKPAPGQSNTLTARAYSMPMLADLLTMFGNPVMDKTGLTGSYDFKFTWNDAEGPALATALQEQLGLKFEAQKVPISLVVIDSAQKPTEN
jgi:uncharacterized protein (TIGR03435 family)